MRSDEKARSKTIRKVLYFQTVENKEYGTKAFYFLDEDDSMYIHYQISISRIKTAAGVREARAWYSMANKLKPGDKVLAACVRREMNNCEFAQKSVYYNVDRLISVL